MATTAEATTAEDADIVCGSEGAMAPCTDCVLVMLITGLPLVYNEARIASFWGKRPGELASRWTRFAAVSGKQGLAMAGVAGGRQEVT